MLVYHLSYESLASVSALRKTGFATTSSLPGATEIVDDIPETSVLAPLMMIQLCEGYLEASDLIATTAADPRYAPKCRRSVPELTFRDSAG